MYFLQALVTDEIISPMCMNRIHIRQIITYNVIFTGGKSFFNVVVKSLLQHLSPD